MVLTIWLGLTAMLAATAADLRLLLVAAAALEPSDPAPPARR